MATIILPTPESTFEVGAKLAPQLSAGAVIALNGPLGAGKTLLAKGITSGLGYPGEVTSPTFTLIHHYEGGRLPVYHLDLYRLSSSNEALRIGIEDYLPGEGITLIEWAERIESLLPQNTVFIQLEILPEGGRRMSIESTGVVFGF